MISESTVEENLLDWIGADVAKASFQVALARIGQRSGITPLRELPTRSFPRTRDGVGAFADWLALALERPRGDLRVRVVMETTGKYSIELAGWMNECGCGLRPAIVHAKRTNAFIKSLNVRGKTDALEARTLAFYGIERRPAPYEPLPPEQNELRELVRHRAHLVGLRTALKNRSGEGSASDFVGKAQERLRRNLDAEIAKTEANMRKVIAKSDQLRRDAKLLESIHGVAFLTAALILGETGDLRRFNRARQLSAFVGLSPRETQSGATVNKPAHLCKQGSAAVRQALYMSALSAIHDKGPMQAAYENACANGKPKMVALGIVMRKLIVLMRAILISGKPFDPQWKNRPNETQPETKA